LDIERLLAGYSHAEARLENGAESVVRIQDDEIKVSSGSWQGVAVRVLQAGSWGFASSNDASDIRGLLEKAARLASLDKGKIKLARTKPVRKCVDARVEQVPVEEQVDALLDAKKGMAGAKITSCRIACSGNSVKKEFYSSQGAAIIQETGYSYLSCSCVAKDGGMLIRGVETSASRKGFRGLDLHGAAKSSREKAERLVGAPVAPRGNFTAVLDPEISGVFAHEAMGHAVEADSVTDRESILAGKIGKTIGNGLLTIVDDPTADDFGGYAYDDEGMEAKRTVVLERGVLRGYINSRETAHETGMEPNGHARAAGYDSVPIVRMSNTYVLPGEQSREEVFDVRHGIYIKGMKGGSVDIFSGGFMFKAEEAYEIRNGELGRVMRDAAISGDILTTLKNVAAVGKDFGTSPGMCGKNGQEAPVSDGGPHVRVDNMMVG
jgi:TldD protein